LSAREKRLHQKKSQLQQEIDELTGKIRQLERSTGKKVGGPGSRSTSQTIRRPNARRLNDVTVAEAIVQLLSESKKPMHYKDVAERLVSEGRYRTRSRNFLSTVAITILRDPRIRRVEPGVYALKK
jgi:hypothetical protein